MAASSARPVVLLRPKRGFMAFSCLALIACFEPDIVQDTSPSPSLTPTPFSTPLPVTDAPSLPPSPPLSPTPPTMSTPAPTTAPPQTPAVATPTVLPTAAPTSFPTPLPTPLLTPLLTPGLPDATAEPTPSPSITPTPPSEPVDWVSHLTSLMAFWTAHNLDQERGGYYTGVSREGYLLNTDKYTRMVSREVYGYVRSFQVTGNRDDLERARLGVDFLLNYAWDVEHGGFYPLLDAEGQIREDSREMFDLVYALTGLTAWLEATADPTVRAVVEDTFARLEAVGWDTTHGGYYESLTTDMSAVLSDAKTFNAQVDNATAYLLQLYDLTSTQGVDADASYAYRSRLNEIATLTVEHVIDPDGTGWVGEYFKRWWEYDPDGGWTGDTTVCGHNFKTVWALLRTYFFTGTWRYRSEAESLFQLAADRCGDVLEPGIFDRIDRQTDEIVTGDEKVWWPQAEAMLSAELLYLLTGDSFYRDYVLTLREYYLEVFLDPVYGEVYTSVESGGTPLNTTKGYEYKSAYHVTELAFFSLFYDALAFEPRPVTLYYALEPYAEDRVMRLSPVELPYGMLELELPITLEGKELSVLGLDQIVIPSGASGTLEVTFQPSTG